MESILKHIKNYKSNYSGKLLERDIAENNGMRVEHAYEPIITKNLKYSLATILGINMCYVMM